MLSLGVIAAAISQIGGGGVPTIKWVRKPIFWPNFAKNCMKMKKIGPRGGVRPKFYYVDQPMNSVISNVELLLKAAMFKY